MCSTYKKRTFSVTMTKLASLFICLAYSFALAINPFIDPFKDDPYGKDGSYSYTIDTIDFVSNGQKGKSFCFLPKETTRPSPVIFFCHGINETNYTTYSGLIKHIVSKGFGLIYTPYKSIPVSNKLLRSYETLYDGFKASVAAHADRFDTNYIGFVAHSFGAGAVPYVSNKLFKVDRWGSGGSFLYLMAPWYPCVLTSAEFASFNSSTNMLIQVFDDDRINDPRIARAIYTLMGIPEKNKKCFTLYSDSIPGYTLSADHNIPCKTTEQISIYHKNALFRTFDLLTSLTFANDSVARHQLFSSCKSDSIVLAQWKLGHFVKAALLSDKVPINHPQKAYTNFWDHVINPLNEFNMNFNCPKPIFFRTRITLKNYWYTAGNKQKNNNDKKDTFFLKPDTGFGADGRWFTESSKIPNPRLRTRFIKVFQPRNFDTLAPVIFISHSFLTSNVLDYMGLIKHLVSKGNIVVYANSVAFEINAPFKSRYDVLMSGFLEAADLLQNRIDTTRIGFIGHGFSAGAMPTIAQDFISKKHWGSNGSFLFLASPWYTYFTNNYKFNNLPQNLKMIVQVYQDDKINDWRMGFDLFNEIKIPLKNKNFIILFSDRNSKNHIIADTKAFCSRIDSKHAKAVNALDIYGTYRLLDGLAAATFFNDSDGQKIALGWDCPEQKFMGKWRDGKPIMELISTDKPQGILKRKRHFWSWNSLFNERRKISSEIK